MNSQNLSLRSDLLWTGVSCAKIHACFGSVFNISDPNDRGKQRQMTLFFTYADNGAGEDEDVALREEIAVGGCFLEVPNSARCNDDYGGWLGSCNRGDAFCKVSIKWVDSWNDDGRVFGSQCRVTRDWYGAVDPAAENVDYKSNVAKKEEKYEEKRVFPKGEKIVDCCDQLWVDRSIQEDRKERLEAIELVWDQPFCRQEDGLHEEGTNEQKKRRQSNRHGDRSI